LKKYYINQLNESELNKKLKIVFKILVLIPMLYFLSIGCIYLWVLNKWEENLTEEDFKNFSEKINESENLPEQFYKAYAIVYENDQNSTTLGLLFSLPWSFGKNSCPCVEVSYPMITNKYERWSLGLKLDKEVSPKKCLDYNLQNFDFLNNAIGIHNASEIYFGKNSIELTEDEYLKLAIMTLNPALYNPFSNSDKLETKFLEYK
jgi:hypothetical protein